jgi:cytochrome c553
VNALIALLRQAGLCWLLAAPLLAVGAPAPGQVPAVDALDSIDARLQGCVTCHERDGRGASTGSYPRIAGKPAGYLYNQLAAFRDGTRRYPPMNYLLAYMPDAYLREIAEHFAQERPPFPPPEATPVEASKLERGHVIATQGDFHTGVPPCVACHGSRLTGMNPAIPGLLGLRASYVESQLARWRTGDRRAAEPDCMKRVADRLGNDDVDAVAAWLATQPAPKDPLPEEQDVERMPYACGSLGEAKR